jgi:hypothetical protein
MNWYENTNCFSTYLLDSATVDMLIYWAKYTNQDLFGRINQRLKMI